MENKQQLLLTCTLKSPPQQQIALDGPHTESYKIVMGPWLWYYPQFQKVLLNKFRCKHKKEDIFAKQRQESWIVLSARWKLFFSGIHFKQGLLKLFTIYLGKCKIKIPNCYWTIHYIFCVSLWIFCFWRNTSQ